MKFFKIETQQEGYKETKWFPVEPSNITAFVYQVWENNSRLFIQFNQNKDYVESFPLGVSPKSTIHVKDLSEAPKTKLVIGKKTVDVYMVTENIKVNLPVMEEVTNNSEKFIAYLDKNVLAESLVQV